MVHHGMHRQAEHCRRLSVVWLMGVCTLLMRVCTPPSSWQAIYRLRLKDAAALRSRRRLSRTLIGCGAQAVKVKAHWAAPASLPRTMPVSSN